jgi:DNA-binding NarL/FixJ family response regulator
MKEKVRILLVDDHTFVRRAIKRLIEVDPGFEVVGEAENAEQAMRAIRRCHPDAVVLDLALQRDDGLALTRVIHARHVTLPILILSLHKETLFAEPALRSGASGYIMKNDAPEHLLAALREVVSDRIYVSDSIRQNIFAKMRTDALRRCGGLRAPGDELPRTLRRARLPAQPA